MQISYFFLTLGQNLTLRLDPIVHIPRPHILRIHPQPRPQILLQLRRLLPRKTPRQLDPPVFEEVLDLRIRKGV